MALRIIQPNFEIPLYYERLFMLCGENGWKYILIVDSNGIHSGEMGGPASKLEKSLCLDFIQESICSVRFELEVDNL